MECRPRRRPISQPGGPSPSPISHLITISPFLKTAAVRQVVFVVTLRLRNKMSESHPLRKSQKKVWSEQTIIEALNMEKKENNQLDFSTSLDKLLASVWLQLS